MSRDVPAKAVQSYTIQDLGTLGGDWSGATHVNSSLQVAGISRTATGEQHIFR